MTSSFDIHVFGDGSGETILLEFCNNKFGIVDFGYKGFLAWFDEHIKLLENPIVEFLLWTHPHDDHTRYLSELLDYLRDKQLTIKNFFKFPFSKFKSLSELMDVGLEQKYDHDIMSKSVYHYVKKTKPKYLLELYNKISDFKKQGIIADSSRIQFATELYKENIIQNDLSIHCIAPTQNEIDKYEELYQNVIDKKCGVESLYPDSGKHNIISTAINIQFGESNIILGGDVESLAWSNIMKNERGKDYTCCELLFLKAPHHGSENAYLKENWNNWGTDFYTAITTYNKSGLPKYQGVQNILNHTKKIFIIKDLHKSSLLGEKSRLMAGKLRIQDEITTCADATNHIKFTIKQNNEIEQTWL